MRAIAPPVYAPAGKELGGGLNFESPLGIDRQRNREPSPWCSGRRWPEPGGLYSVGLRLAL